LQQQTLALACIADAILFSLDPSGDAMQRTCFILREGLAIADGMGAKSDASELVRHFLKQLEENG
jgi:hypothetical protein